MNHHTHMAAGALAGMTFCLATHTEGVRGVVVIAGSVIGSLLPDLDCKSSFIANRAKITRSVSIITEKILGHRGVLHTPFFASCLPIMYMGILHTCFTAGNLGTLVGLICFGAGLMIGYFVHLGLDLITPRGIMLFYPFSKKYYRLPCRILDSKGEDFIWAVLYLCDFVIFVTH